MSSHISKFHHNDIIVVVPTDQPERAEADEGKCNTTSNSQFTGVNTKIQCLMTKALRFKRKRELLVSMMCQCGGIISAQLV